MYIFLSVGEIHFNLKFHPRLSMAIEAYERLTGYNL